MNLHTKGFTLLELLVALAIAALLLGLVVPAYRATVQRVRADTEINQLRQALAYARLEAINRRQRVGIRPAAKDAPWNGELMVYAGQDPGGNVLRVVPAISPGATLTLTSNDHSIDFNRLGGLAASDALHIVYGLDQQRRVISVCLNGRVIAAENCG
jgi:type IV fimbrial biogenesis protein FimU